MTKEEAKGNIIHAIRWNDMPKKEALEMAVKALEQEPCEDAISRRAVIDMTGLSEWFDSSDSYNEFVIALSELPPVTPQPKAGHCKDCKRWKDSDGVYRRGIGAESGCPINRKEVYDGNGYCFLFEKKESEE